MTAEQKYTEEDIWDLINKESVSLDKQEGLFFDALRIMPEKWSLPPYGDHNDGFWVVGIIGQMVLWYNHIEDGFNSSRYSKYGIINEYWCNQDSLPMAIRSLKLILETGSHNRKARPPTPI